MFREDSDRTNDTDTIEYATFRYDTVESKWKTAFIEAINMMIGSDQEIFSNWGGILYILGGQSLKSALLYKILNENYSLVLGIISS